MTKEFENKINIQIIRSEGYSAGFQEGYREALKWVKQELNKEEFLKKEGGSPKEVIDAEVGDGN